MSKSWQGSRVSMWLLESGLLKKRMSKDDGRRGMNVGCMEAGHGNPRECGTAAMRAIGPARTLLLLLLAASQGCKFGGCNYWCLLFHSVLAVPIQKAIKN